VNWKAIERDGKLSKPPYQPNGKLAESNNTSTWNLFSVVEEAAPSYDGVGFVLTKDDRFVGLDFDDCRCPAFELIDPIVGQYIHSLVENPLQVGTPFRCKAAPYSGTCRQVIPEHAGRFL
jgi:primase-polymerase (primpol)-like protein